MVQRLPLPDVNLTNPSREETEGRRNGGTEGWRRGEGEMKENKDRKQLEDQKNLIQEEEEEEAHNLRSRGRR